MSKKRAADVLNKSFHNSSEEKNKNEGQQAAKKTKTIKERKNHQPHIQ